MRPITLAIVGKGHWGNIYFKTISSMKNISLPQKYLLGRDYKNILTRKELKNVDGVIVASPSPTHLEVVETLIKNEYKYLLIEKPMTHSPEAAKKLLELEKKSGAHLMVGHVHMYDPAYRALKKFAKTNLGKITKISYWGLQSPPTGASILQDWGPHPLSVFLDMAGTKPLSVNAKNKSYDNVELTLKYKNNLTCKALVGTQYPLRKRQIEIIGEKGKLFLDGFMNPRKLIFTDKKGKTKKITFADKTPLQMQISEFVKMIKTNKRPKTSISKGFTVVNFIKIAENSLT